MVKDSSGQVITALAEKIKKPHNVDCLEMLATRRVVRFAHEIGLQQCHFEGDSEGIIKALVTRDMLSSSYGHLVRDTLCCVNSFRSSSFSHIARQGNSVAHALAQRARLSFLLLVWMEDVPFDKTYLVFGKTSWALIFFMLQLCLCFTLSFMRLHLQA